MTSNLKVAPREEGQPKPQLTQVAKAGAMDDLGDYRRLHLSLEGERKHVDLKELDAKKRVNQVGTKEWRKHQKDQPLVSAWKTLAKSDDSSADDADTSDIGSGQSHRKALFESLTKGPGGNFKPRGGADFQHRVGAASDAVSHRPAIKDPLGSALPGQRAVSHGSLQARSIPPTKGVPGRDRATSAQLPVKIPKGPSAKVVKGTAEVKVRGPTKPISSPGIAQQIWHQKRKQASTKQASTQPPIPEYRANLTFHDKRSVNVLPLPGTSGLTSGNLVARFNKPASGSSPKQPRREMGASEVAVRLHLNRASNISDTVQLAAPELFMNATDKVFSGRKATTTSASSAPIQPSVPNGTSPGQISKLDTRDVEALSEPLSVAAVGNLLDIGEQRADDAQNGGARLTFNFTPRQDSDSDPNTRGLQKLMRMFDVENEGDLLGFNSVFPNLTTVDDVDDTVSSQEQAPETPSQAEEVADGSVQLEQERTEEDSLLLDFDEDDQQQQLVSKKPAGLLETTQALFEREFGCDFEVQLTGINSKFAALRLHHEPENGSSQEEAQETASFNSGISFLSAKSKLESEATGIQTQPNESQPSDAEPSPVAAMPKPEPTVGAVPTKHQQMDSLIDDVFTVKPVLQPATKAEEVEDSHSGGRSAIGSFPTTLKPEAEVKTEEIPTRSREMDQSDSQKSSDLSNDHQKTDLPDKEPSLSPGQTLTRQVAKPAGRVFSSDMSASRYAHEPSFPAKPNETAPPAKARTALRAFSGTLGQSRWALSENVQPDPPTNPHDFQMLMLSSPMGIKVYNTTAAMAESGRRSVSLGNAGAVQQAQGLDKKDATEDLKSRWISPK